MSGIALMHDAALAAIADGRYDDAEKVIRTSLERERSTIRELRDLTFAIEPLVLRDHGFAAAWLVLGARDPRRFVIGAFGAMAIWFVVLQPDIAALPVPTGIARLFQTLPLATYNYDFQFAVNMAAATQTSLLSVESLALTAMVAFLVGATMSAVRAWRTGSTGAPAAALP